MTLLYFFLVYFVLIVFFSPSEPSAAPIELRVSKINSTKVNIHWVPVDPSTVNGEFKEYKVSDQTSA